MGEKFCINCGSERLPAAQFCGNCGKVFSTAKDKTVATIENVVGARVEKVNRKSKPKTIANIVVNIVFSLLLLVSYSIINRQMQWGGGESYLIILLLIMIGLQIFTLILQRKRKSYTLIIPAIISFISIFRTVSLYRDFSLWLKYQGNQTQDLVSGDLVMIMIYIVFFIVSTLLNVIFLFRKK
jgi:hypothetical protein